MARPKKQSRLEHTVGVRLSLHDYSEAQVRAMTYGLPVSAWLREAAFGRRLAKARPAVNHEVWGLLGRLIATVKSPVLGPARSRDSGLEVQLLQYPPAIFRFWRQETDEDI
ncbi:plasmid mobilization protein [Desulfovibrio aminophilus]|uniref:plasmid mobilization protein n=1 Tax=Desulfovibrio aminophilus TaxID=81425 RepID=UPI003CCBB6DB